MNRRRDGVIENISHVVTGSADNLGDLIIEAVQKLQERELVVEIQYSTSASNDFLGIVYSALIIGRMLENKKEIPWRKYLRDDDE